MSYLPTEQDLTTQKFDVVEFLQTEEEMQFYLAEMLEEGTPDEIIQALNDIARARGIAQLAKDTGLGRESLYKTLSQGSKPRFETILSIIRALGMQLSTVPKQEVRIA
ncbi:hypothetical protein A4G20_00315 [Pasteurellaceae bacterium RH1A]|nr:hypothetical protein A4G20_00315 [Pasteurellaceae bacterium RH1A]